MSEQMEAGPAVNQEERDWNTFQPPWGPIGEPVFIRSYSQTLNRQEIHNARVHNRNVEKTGVGLKIPVPAEIKESWYETVTRAVDGNLALVDPQHIEADERRKLTELLMLMAALPAGRHLNASGMKGKQFLFNCLSGDTMVQTRQGLRPIRDLANQEIEVLSMAERTESGIGCWRTPSTGVWRKAKFQSFGKQSLYEVVFSDGSKVRATADHRWYVTKRSNPIKTTNLKGMDVPFVAPPKPERNEDYNIGVLAGFVYGDGAVSVNNGVTYSANVQIFAEKDLDLVPLFEKHGFTVTYPKYCKAYIGKLPSQWKELPAYDASNSYWLGFINGLIASDGTVDKSGSIFIYQSNKDALEFIQKKAQEVGFVTSPLYLQRANNPWTGEPAACWRLNLRRFSVEESDLVLNHHRLNFIEAGEAKTSSMKVIEVNPLNLEEEVYCAIEPVTHTFVIGNNILTGNCHGAGWDPKRPWLHFSFLFDELMQGGGVGANYSNRYLDEMPELKKHIDLRVICREDHPDRAEFADLLSSSAYASGPYLAVQDSREGWVEAAEMLMKHAWGFNGDEDTFTIDVSPVREKGAPLISSGGTSCGPGPLVTMLFDMVKVLNRCVGEQLSSLDAMDLDHAMAACVVAGGKRRSSRMSVKSWKDLDIFDFIQAKSEDGKHWSTNLSVETDDEFEEAWNDDSNPWHHRARNVAAMVWQMARTNGEPAFWNRSLAAKGEREPEKMYCPNPCGEIGLHMWENCNLGHVNVQHFASRPPRKMKEAFRLITRWLVRATFGDIPRQEQRQVVDQNRRIGVGFFGFHGWLAMNGVKFSECWKNEWVKNQLASWRQVIDSEAARYADEIGIPRPVKTTTLAPTGTISLLPGVTSGIQPIYARYFKRRVRYADTDPQLAEKKVKGYPVEKALRERNTEIVTYYCADPLVEAIKARGFDETVIEGQDEIALDDYLEVQAMIQDVYANNAISFTINVPAEKMPETEALVSSVMRLHHRLKGTTIFPDKSRLQSPYERLTKEEFDAWTGYKEITQVEDECKTGCPT